NHGTLDLESTVSAAGNIVVMTSGILEIDANQTSGVSFASDATGTLRFDHPYNSSLPALSAFTFTGTISGLVEGDKIDLVNLAANTDVQSATVNGSVLTVKTVNEGTLTYTISTLPSGDGFKISSDGNGGTYLTVAKVYDFTVSGNGVSFPPFGQHTVGLRG